MRKKYFYYAETRGDEVTPGKYANGVFQSSKKDEELIKAIEDTLQKELGYKFVIMSLTKL